VKPTMTVTGYPFVVQNWVLQELSHPVHLYSKKTFEETYISGQQFNFKIYL
jgi:hypothetical protein